MQFRRRRYRETLPPDARRTSFGVGARLFCPAREGRVQISRPYGAKKRPSVGPLRATSAIPAAVSKFPGRRSPEKTAQGHSSRTRSVLTGLVEPGHHDSEEPPGWAARLLPGCQCARINPKLRGQVPLRPAHELPTSAQSLCKGLRLGDGIVAQELPDGRQGS